MEWVWVGGGEDGGMNAGEMVLVAVGEVGGWVSYYNVYCRSYC